MAGEVDNMSLDGPDSAGYFLNVVEPSDDARVSHAADTSMAERVDSVAESGSIEEAESRHIGTRTAYQLLDAQALLTAMSVSDDVKDRRRAYDIGADLLRDRTARESGHVMVLTDAAIRFLTEAIEGDNVDNRVKALVHANGSLKHWASAGTQGVSVLDVAPLLSLINRTVARASQSDDPAERLGVLSVAGSLTMLDRDVVSDRLGKALDNMPKRALKVATVSAAVRNLYSGVVSYEQISTYVNEILDTFEYDGVVQLLLELASLRDPEKNATLMSSKDWHGLARRWYRRSKELRADDHNDRAASRYAGWLLQSSSDSAEIEKRDAKKARGQVTTEKRTARTPSKPVK